MPKSTKIPNLNIKDLLKLIKQASKLGVSELQIGDLYINYNIESDESQEKFVSTKISDKLEQKTTDESLEELKEYRKLLDNETLDCEDPEGYEEMIFNRTKVQKQDTPDE